MSRIGRKPIEVDKNVKVKIEAGIVSMESAKGKLSYQLPWGIEAKLEDNKIIVERKNNTKDLRAKHGLARALLANMVEGLKNGFKKELEIVGVGYKVQMKGKTLVMNLGFSHPVEINPPEGIKISAASNTRIVIEGIDKALVGEVAAKIRAIYPPEPYKGKGVRYLGEQVRKKLGKAMAK